MSRSPLRRVCSALAAAASVLVLAACNAGSSVDLGVANSDGMLQAAIAGEPDQLDPHKTTSYFSFQVLENVYDTLVEPDENLKMQPALAESWEVSEDQLTWTFQLREGVTFHDGSEFTAEDVVYSYTRIIDQELSNAWRFAAVESIEATGDYEVEMTVASPSPALLSSLGVNKGMAIVEETNAESGDLTTQPVGTGPFSLLDARPGDSITLQSNPDYWGGAPAIDGVQYSFISEPTTAVAALRSGEVDWTDSIPPQQVAALSQDSALQLNQLTSNDYWYVALNQGREPWDDVRVRQAIAYAVDRESIAQVTGYGTAEINQLAIPTTSPWYDEYDTYSTDLERARALLDEAGVAGDDLEMEFMVTNEYPETVTAAQVMADNLEPLGISVSIRTLDFGSWLDQQTQGNFDALMMGWLGNIDPSDYYYSQHHSEGASNAQGYSNPEVDSLLDEAASESDEATRKDLYDQAATIIADEVSYLYLYNPAVIQAWTTAVSGYEIRSDRAIRFRDADVSRD